MAVCCKIFIFIADLIYHKFKFFFCYCSIVKIIIKY